MTLDEFNSKWKTGPAKIDCVLANTDPPIKFKRDGFEHSAPLGDYMEEYLKHMSIPWWRRGWDWKIVCGLFRDKLNSIEVKFTSLS